MARKILDLNGSEWQLGQAPSGALPSRASWDELAQIADWLPAQVPGNVRADLARAGRLPDLVYGSQAKAAQWVDNHSWWLRRSVDCRPSPSERVHLVLRGVDYIGDLFLNGYHLGRHEGMFSPQIHDITPFLQERNELALRILGSRWLPTGRSSFWLRLLNLVESSLSNIGRDFPQRRDTLKCQMGFGWDFAPALRTMGIWDDVYAVTSDEIFVRDVQLRSEWTDDGTELQIDVTIDALAEQNVEVRCRLSEDGSRAEGVAAGLRALAPPGTSQHSLQLVVRNPRLWWPWDHGSPDLYRLDLEVWKGNRCLDWETRLVGLRHVEWNGWTLRVNGKRIYARGANWVPASVLPGCVAESDYHQLLSLARKANMNMLRVWGGGLREKNAFYELCDRMGILVWQEFPLACAFLTRLPDSSSYLRLLENETRAIVRDLRSHPSLVLWCGGNEFDPGRNRPAIAVMRRVVGEEDPERTFRPASPSGGDGHNWNVWHGFQPPSSYAHDPSLFASEFGLQSPPSVSALEQFIPAKDLWPPGPAWPFHGAELEKLWRYARPYLNAPDPSLAEFVGACQLAQARGLQIAIEHFRRGKARGGGGVLVWQLNEPWPAISWALVDDAREPKAAYEMVKQLMAPLLISLEYPLVHYRAGDTLCGKVWVINDRDLRYENCQVEVNLWSREGQAVERLRQRVDVAADTAQITGELAWRLPPGGNWRITCFLLQDKEVLAANDYDLGRHDSGSPTARRKLRTWLRNLVVPPLRD